ncbi:4-hydroxybenzoate octaprenyltransferase [Legionella massiliensis]|uniref:4-hydroxybenzoate octaprenyltransferase n=1 Tax=Legionella massiliensis TaxID=1034943 RepID=A0A078L527_9GAMM|nr:4-hydroxybenzoate octaprenyltransferase [Legionella massiliensis]CDZ79174.1 4-hydroxybenzoate octaprenyltransferase [Legionella massiliensis]CEE14912.1 4-hydroxybenzoate octaprenyltransferase [Legionella massiliensis]
MGPYLRLMRFHRLAGIWLLWFPTAWALWLANKETPPLALIILFFLGTVLMRAAGCVVNDIADRHVDLHVKRTAMRPLVTGEVSLGQALALLLVLLFAALLILIQLPPQCFYYALAAVFVTVLYPFCKRFIQGPQFVLGIAFSMGIPMAFAASKQLPNTTMVLLLIINFCWIVAYDTQYAMVDKDDDLRIGVKSTAILFASYDKVIISSLQVCLHLLWLVLALELQLSKLFFAGWLVAGLVLLYQYRLVVKGNRDSYFQAFTSNSWYGLIMWLALTLP